MNRPKKEIGTSGANIRGATLKDVAVLAGVGPATVSVALHGSRSGTRVSEETRRRIQKAAEELRYRPNALARSLKGGRTHIFGYYRYFSPGPPSAFDAEVIAGLQEGCNAERMDLLLQGAFEGRSSQEVYARLSDRRMDALILLTFPDDPLAEHLRGEELPVVAIADAIPGIPSVVADDAQGGRLMAAHLYEKGHRDVVYIDLRRSPVSMARRYAGFLSEAQAREMTVETYLTDNAGPPDWGVPAWDDPEFVALFSGELRGRRPTAFACWSDVGAIALRKRLQERGVRVPEEAAIIGFDGIELYGMTLGGLTTISSPMLAVARTAVSLLCQRLRGEIVPEETVLPVSLRPGDTT